MELLQVFINVCDEYEDDLLGNQKYYRRKICVPFVHIYYIQECIDKKETEIGLTDGQIIIANERYEIIYQKWFDWINNDSRLGFYSKAN